MNGRKQADQVWYKTQLRSINMNIAEHRAAIDRIDEQIVQLINERTKHVLAIGQIKRKLGQEIYAPHREETVLRRICQINTGPMPNEALRNIYREILSGSRALEKPLTVAYLGPEATFTHQAAIKKFGHSTNYLPLKTIPDIFAEVSRRTADYGVVPIENSTEGVVTHTLDMLIDSDLKIVAQIILPIQHCLVAKSAKTNIRKLYSHPQALAQCRRWIHENLSNVDIIETSSTARAAELAAKNPDSAAIASALAAEKFGLKILASDIQDSSTNITRFLVLGRQIPPPTGNDKTSLLFAVADRVGALHDALACFKRHKINLTKIESRPSKRRAWEYYFFAECEGHMEDTPVKKAIKLLGHHCTFVRILGSYPNTE
jgi:chorismate mutase/prephenate dehydratase